MNIGVPELLIVLLVVLIIFGGSQLPKLARSLGSAHKEFKKGLEDEGDETADEKKTDSK
jgi:sec-independent protein translocase protein TatA